MRTPTLFAFAVLGLTLASCASGGGISRYESELQRLNADCEARGGILVPTGNLQSGRPQLENVCQIRGHTARAPGG